MSLEAGKVTDLKYLHEIFSEIDFLVVSYRGGRYLSDAFDPMKKYCS